MKVILIIGLPASGKTTYGKSLIKNDNEYFYDEDLTKINALPNKTKLVIFSHPLFCDKNKLENFKEYINKIHIANIEEIYFENDYKQCLINDEKRNGKSYNSIIQLTKIYKPNNINLLRVFKGEPK